MKLSVITQPGDTVVLLRCLSGRYASSRRELFAYWSLAVVCAAVGFSQLWRLIAWTPSSRDDRTILILGVFLGCVCAAICAVRASTSYLFSPEAVAEVSPLPLFSRSMPASEIRDAWVSFEQEPVLHLRSVRGTSLAIPVEGRLRKDLTRLYPELGREPSFATPILDVSYRRLIWFAVAILFVATLVIGVLLTSRGVLAW